MDDYKAENETLVVCQKIKDFVLYFSPLTENYTKKSIRYSYGEMSRVTMREIITSSRMAKMMKTSPEKLSMIDKTDRLKDDLETDVELAFAFGCITKNSFSTAGQKLSEIGRLINGWKKAVQTAIKKGDKQPNG